MTARSEQLCQADRELLRLAALAAGMKVNEWAEPGELLPDKGGWVQFVGHGHAVVWNSLTDDGDALRLAVRLRIDVCWNQNQGPWEVNAWPQGHAMGANEGPEDHNGDPCTATRRAITRAAANIGRSLSRATGASE